MKKRTRRIRSNVNPLFAIATIGIAAGLCSVGPQSPRRLGGAEPAKRIVLDNAPATVGEARIRARILHETIHGALQVVHRDFFREDEGLTIPSRSLEDVFRELTRSHDVQVRWLAVDTDAMNVDHNPKTDFEKAAVKALTAGKDEFEIQEAGAYRHVGRIRLSSQCLKCHLPQRTSTDDRAAGLMISMPLKTKNGNP